MDHRVCESLLLRVPILVGQLVGWKLRAVPVSEEINQFFPPPFPDVVTLTMSRGTSRDGVLPESSKGAMASVPVVLDDRAK